MNSSGGNWIGGHWRQGEAPMASLDPADGTVLGEVTAASLPMVDEAVQAAAAAYEKWRITPAPARGEILFRLGQLLQQRKETLARLISQENGKILTEALGEVQEAIDIAFYMGGEGRRLFGVTAPSELQRKWALAVRVPLGVVAGITPWNFPIALPAWKVCSSLIAGNTLVWKPSPLTPLTACAFAKLLEEAGVPQGVVNLVQGDTAVGQRLITHPAVRLVSFTGSTAVGKAIEAAVAGMLKRVHLELGGKNAIIVCADADLDLAAEGIIWSTYGTSGQRCVSCGRIYVEKSVCPALEEALAHRVRSLRLGRGLDPATQVGPVIRPQAVESIYKSVRGALAGGAKLLAGGEPSVPPGLDRGFYYAPTLLSGVSPEQEITRNETFGPVGLLIEGADFAEMIELTNRSTYGLSNAIFTRDINKAMQAVDALESGLVYVNAGTIGAEMHLPFGGMKESGNGHRDLGQAALEVYTEWKTVYIDFSSRLQRAQIDV